jgi:nucleotidyltransferase AbiEii toxin of type IV toxin-antitoxin system
MAGETPELPQHLVTGLLEHVQALDRFHLSYALIGGIAAGYRSRPRFTQDLDFLLDVPQLVLPTLLDDLQGRGFAFDPPTAIREWTSQHFTMLSFHGVRIDWLEPVLSLYRHVIDRAQPQSWLGRSVRIASAEGLILTKLIAFRGQDLVDIENLLAANRGLLDLEFIDQEWKTVAGPDDPRSQRFKEMVAKLYLPGPDQEVS